jgi:eukaryotic-like serine/threonine-protein kinase
MGAVWVATNELVDANVALKVLHRDRNGADDAAKRFRHEARLGSKLRHRSITRVFDLVEETDGSLVLVMELLHGRTLEARLREPRPLSPEEAVAIAVPILSALDHAHEQGVLHRDVKPSNIYLSVEPDGQTVPKLLDFGIAKGGGPADYQTVDGDVLGTPGYMSPEHIRAITTEIDRRSDLFSMGVVLYEMITGAPPFDAAAPSARLAAVLETEVDTDPRIPPKLWVEVHRALSKRPSERHASARAMAVALCQAIGLDEGSLAKLLRTAPPAPPTRLSDNRTADGVEASITPVPPPSRSRRAVAIAVFVVCAGAAALVTRARATATPPAPTASATPAMTPTPTPTPTLTLTPTPTPTLTPTLTPTPTPSSSTPPKRPKPPAAAPGPSVTTPRGFAPNPGF